MRTGGLLTHYSKQKHSSDIDSKSFSTSHSFAFDLFPPADKSANEGKLEALEKQEAAMLPSTSSSVKQTDAADVRVRKDVKALLALFSASHKWISMLII